MWHVAGGVSKARLYWEHGVLLYTDVAGVTARVASSVLIWLGIACRFISFMDDSRGCCRRMYGSGQTLGAGACWESCTGLGYQSCALCMHTIMHTIGISTKILHASVPGCLSGPGLSSISHRHYRALFFYTFTTVPRHAIDSLATLCGPPAETPAPHRRSSLKIAQQYRLLTAVGRLAASFLCVI
jgi:hypothetical protein